MERMAILTIWDMKFLQKTVYVSLSLSPITVQFAVYFIPLL